MSEPTYDATARSRTANSDPERRLYDTIADREGWAWQLGRARHLATDREVVVDLTGPPPSPFRVDLVPGDTPWWHHDPLTAVRQVEMHGEPRYTLIEARQVDARTRCAAEGHTLRVQYAATGSPDSVRCARCADWWPVAAEHLDYVLDALVAALRFASPQELPLVPGHPWYDAVAHYRPEQAEQLRAEEETRAKALAAMTAQAWEEQQRPLRAVPTTPEPGMPPGEIRPAVDAPTVPAQSVIDAPTVATQPTLALVRPSDAAPTAAR